MKHFSKSLLALSLLLSACNKQESSTFEASAIVEGTAVKVAAQTGGYLLQVGVNEGDEVVLGQTIAVVDTEKLSYQLEQVQAGVEEIGVQRRLAETNLRRAKEDFEYAQTRYERFLDLFQKNAASEQTRDDAKINLDRGQTAYDAARQNIQVLTSKVKGLEAQAKLLRRQINDATVKAPLNGTITTRYYDTGETIPPNAPVVEIIDLSQMWTKIFISETYLPKVQIGQTAHVRIDGTEQTLAGTVAWISTKAEFTPKNILTQESRTALVYAVKINLDNPEKILKHGMPVAIALEPRL